MRYSILILALALTACGSHKSNTPGVQKPLNSKWTWASDNKSVLDLTTPNQVTFTFRDGTGFICATTFSGESSGTYNFNGCTTLGGVALTALSEKGTFFNDVTLTLCLTNANPSYAPCNVYY